MGKADKLLGLDGSAETTAILVQKEGWVEKSATIKAKSFKRVWAVVKDGFFLWYQSPKSDDNKLPFDTKPKGVIPLGGCLVNLDTKDKRVISMRHPDVPSAAFKLRSSQPGETLDWLAALEGAKKATWDNALLGSALIDNLQASGTKLEKEKEAAFQTLQNKAKKLQIEQEQKEKLLLKDFERQNAFQQKLDEEQGRVRELESAKQSVAETLSKEAKSRKSAARKRMSVERKLAKAEAALKQLENAMIVRNQGKLPKSLEREDDEVRASVGALKSFFEARVNEQTVLARSVYERLPATPPKPQR